VPLHHLFNPIGFLKIPIFHHHFSSRYQHIEPRRSSLRSALENTSRVESCHDVIAVEPTDSCGLHNEECCLLHHVSPGTPRCARVSCGSHPRLPNFSFGWNIDVVERPDFLALIDRAGKGKRDDRPDRRRRHHEPGLVMKARHRAHALLKTVELCKQNGPCPKQALHDRLKVRMPYTGSSIAHGKVVRVVCDLSPKPRQNPAKVLSRSSSLLCTSLPRSQNRADLLGRESTCSVPAEPAEPASVADLAASLRSDSQTSP